MGFSVPPQFTVDNCISRWRYLALWSNATEIGNSPVVEWKQRFVYFSVIMSHPRTNRRAGKKQTKIINDNLKNGDIIAPLCIFLSKTKKKK